MKKTNSKIKSAPENVSELETIRLWTKAGARCEFPGCNDYLWQDSLTLKEANFSQKAHIVAKKLNGPRGNSSLPMEERNKAENLMLLCAKHHHEIDDGKLKNEFPDEVLREYKRIHEERIKHQTSVIDDSKTYIIKLEANINGEAVRIADGQIYSAISPMYPSNEGCTSIDLTNLPNKEDKTYWDMGRKIIDEKVSAMLNFNVNGLKIKHCSLFAISSIPLLIYLGSKLTNKITVDLYQKHRDTGDWKWKDGCSKLDYSFREIKSGDNGVALIISLSGAISISDLPAKHQAGAVYEILIKNPNPTFLKTKECLALFVNKYLEAIGTITKKHPGLKEINFFPAIPSPIAISCGKELLKKVHPTMVIYDNNKEKGGFKKIMKVN